MNTVQSGTQTVRKKDTLEEELTISSVEKRNWRGIFIALLVIAGVLGLIVFSIFLLSPDLENPKIFGRKLMLHEITENYFSSNELNCTFASDIEVAFRNSKGGISLLNLENGSLKELVKNSTIRQLDVNQFVLSPNQNFVLLYNNLAKGSRTNEQGLHLYYIFDTSTQNYFLLSPNQQAETAEESPLNLQKVVWSPLSHPYPNKDVQSLNNGSFQPIAFVYQYDVYFKFDVLDDQVHRVTKNGAQERVLNGIPDWLYGFALELRTETLAFSKQGSFLAFISFNVSNVHLYRFTSDYDDSMPYPTVKSIKYPKTNTPNPIVTVYVADVSTPPIKHVKKIYIPFQHSEEYYIGSLSWVTDTELSFSCNDRNQTKAITYVCKAPAFECVEVLVEEQFDNGFISPSEEPIFIRKSIKSLKNFSEETFILKRLPIRVGKHANYRHLVATRISNIRSKSKIRRYILTYGKYEVTQIAKFDPVDDTIYYTATKEDRPGYRHFYKLKVDFNFTNDSLNLMAKVPICLTCYKNSNFQHASSSLNASADLTIFDESFNILTKFGDTKVLKEDTIRGYNEGDKESNCLYNNIRISPNSRYYLQECLGPNVPASFIIETKSNKRVLIWDDNINLVKRFDKIAIPNIKKFSVLIRHGFEAQVKLFLPPHLNEDEDLAFPLLVHIDAAPGSQLVSEAFSVDWNWYLASTKSIIVAQIDARGSGFQGENSLSQVKGNLGAIEVEDQLAILTYLKDTFQFIDPTKMGLYGWGYGGYVALNSIAEDSIGILQFSIAIAPIVSFRFYYSFFSERFLPLNETFQAQLKNSDLSSKAKLFNQKNIFLIQGSADQVVHLQHLMWFSKSLVKHDVAFRQMIYVDEDFYLQGVRQHLYKTLESYIDEKFDLDPDKNKKLNGLFGF